MLPAWVTTADDAQVATSAHVRDLADSLATALASVQHEVDNPVLGAHCNCKVEEQDLPPDYPDCLGFCEEREDWADAQRQDRWLELVERPIRSLLLQADAAPKLAIPVYRGVLAGLQKLLNEKTLDGHDVIFSGSTSAVYDSPDGLLSDLLDLLLESDHLEEEAHDKRQRHLDKWAATEKRNHDEAERRCKEGTLTAMKLEDFKGGLDLRSFCENHCLKKSGKKDALVARIISYFSDTPEGRAQRQKYATKQSEKAQMRQRANDRRVREKQEEAAMEDGYCCDTPKFDYHAPPAGMITFKGGACAETWRCLSCGKIPPKPNAKGARMDEFSDESDSDW